MCGVSQMRASKFKFNTKIKNEAWNVDGYFVALISFISVKILCYMKQISKPPLVPRHTRILIYCIRKVLASL